MTIVDPTIGIYNSIYYTVFRKKLKYLGTIRVFVTGHVFANVSWLYP